MTQASDNNGQKTKRNKPSLKEALYVVKNRQADRDDVVVDMLAAEEARLEILADELSPLMDEVDPNDERFEFALSQGDRPRLWIDITSFVFMGHDRRVYRFVKDTRMGRVVLAESGDMQSMAGSVAEYVAEKVLERERAIEGEWISLKNDATEIDLETDDDEEDEQAALATVQSSDSGFGQLLLAVVLGSGITIAALVAAAFFFGSKVF